MFVQMHRVLMFSQTLIASFFLASCLSLLNYSTRKPRHIYLAWALQDRYTNVSKSGVFCLGDFSLRRNPASACNTGTTQTHLHHISNTQRTGNKTTDVVIQQHSRKLVMMDILMSETCWVHKKRNKTASDIKLVFYSSRNTAFNEKKQIAGTWKRWEQIP